MIFNIPERVARGGSDITTRGLIDGGRQIIEDYSERQTSFILTS
jgi:hypothetical protein